jgi:hypothetical protein
MKIIEKHFSENAKGCKQDSLKKIWFSLSFFGVVCLILFLIGLVNFARTGLELKIFLLLPPE